MDLAFVVSIQQFAFTISNKRIRTRCSVAKSKTFDQLYRETIRNLIIANLLAFFQLFLQQKLIWSIMIDQI